MCQDTDANESPIYQKQTYGGGKAKDKHINEKQKDKRTTHTLTIDVFLFFGTN